MGINTNGKVTFSQLISDIEEIEEKIKDLTGRIGVIKHEVGRGTPEAVKALESAEIKLDTALSAAAQLYACVAGARLSTRQAGYRNKLSIRLKDLIGDREGSGSDDN